MQAKQKLQKPRDFTGYSCRNIVSYWDEKAGKGLIVIQSSNPYNYSVYTFNKDKG